MHVDRLLHGAICLCEYVRMPFKCWCSNAFYTGFDSFSNVSYGLVGGGGAGPGGWLDQEAGVGGRSGRAEELGSRSNRYEPELGFIDAEQVRDELTLQLITLLSGQTLESSSF